MQVGPIDQKETNDFKIHCIGGVYFFTAMSGETGQVDFTDDNMSKVVDTIKPMDKYLLGDNGVVYEYKISSEEGASANVALYPYNSSTSKADSTNLAKFIVSDDQDAQAKLKELIAEHKNDE